MLPLSVAFKDLNPHQRRLLVVFLLTTFYLVVEFLGGLFTQSLALLADAGHMLTDASALGLAFFAARMTERPATPKHTFGYYRAEILAALANAAILVGISIYILVEALRRFHNPPHVDSTPMLLIASIGLLINCAGAIILSPSTKQSLNIRGAYYEVILDLVSSIGAIIAAIIMNVTGWYYIDPILSAGIGLFILPGTWMLLTESISILLEGSPSELNTLEVIEKIKTLKGISGLHDLHIWTLTSGINALSVHVVLDGTLAHNYMLTQIEKMIKSEFNITHLTIQLEDPETKTCRHDLAKQIVEIASPQGTAFANPK